LVVDGRNVVGDEKSLTGHVRLDRDDPNSLIASAEAVGKSPSANYIAPTMAYDKTKPGDTEPQGSDD
jgi:hypothetical protein